MKPIKQYTDENRDVPVDMTLSENALGCSPMAVKALQSLTMEDIVKYPDTAALEDKISELFGIRREEMVLGCGSEQLIKLVCQTFGKKRDRVLAPGGSTFLFVRETAIAGMTFRFWDTTTLLQQPTIGVRILFLCNPATPTGVLMNQQMIESTADRFRNSIVVIDEAIGDFVPSTSFRKAVVSDNLIVLKTLSKCWGLAGLRIGFAVGPVPLISKLKASQQPFPVSAPSVKIALAALSDGRFIARTRKFITRERTFLMRELSQRGFTVSDSVTNNLFVECDRTKKLVPALKNAGVAVIDGSFFPGNTKPGFRITVKDRKTNKAFLRGIDKALACTGRRKLLPLKEAL